MSFPWMVFLAGCLSAPVPAAKPAVPTGSPPEIWLAQVVVVGGNVTIHFHRPRMEPMFEEVVGSENGKIARKMKIVYRAVLQELPVVPMGGPDVRAYSRDLKAIETGTLSKTLKAPKQVVVFPQGDPDFFYLSVVRDDAVIFAVNAARLFGAARSDPKEK